MHTNWLTHNNTEQSTRQRWNDENLPLLMKSLLVHHFKLSDFPFCFSSFNYRNLLEKNIPSIFSIQRIWIIKSLCSIFSINYTNFFRKTTARKSFCYQSELNKRKILHIRISESVEITILVSFVIIIVSPTAEGKNICMRNVKKSMHSTQL